MPDTFSYYVAAYVVAGAVYAGYVLSLVARASKLPRAGTRGSSRVTEVEAEKPGAANRRT